MRRPRTRPHVLRDAEGTVWAEGFMTGDVMNGSWKWYRKDGSLLRTGSFEDDEQVGEWTTYGPDGKPLKVTQMRPPKRRPRKSRAKPRTDA